MLTKSYMMDIILRDGFDFSFDPNACKTCPGNCCIGESGNIWVNQKEIIQICSFLQMNIVDFIRTYLNTNGNRYSIKENLTKNGFACYFFDGLNKQCSIYPVRPFQCRQYPFWKYFKTHKENVIKECPGIFPKKESLPQ